MKNDQQVTKMHAREVADFFGITPDTLRYYERQGVIPPVQRDSNGYRVYTDAELNWLYLALNLKRAGLSLEKITEFVQLVREVGIDSQKAQKALLKEQLTEIDKQLANLQDTRDVLQNKMDTFDEHLAKIETGERVTDDIPKEWQNYRK